MEPNGGLNSALVYSMAAVVAGLVAAVKMLFAKSEKCQAQHEECEKLRSEDRATNAIAKADLLSKLSRVGATAARLKKQNGEQAKQLSVLESADDKRDIAERLAAADRHLKANSAYVQLLHEELAKRGLAPPVVPPVVPDPGVRSL